MDVEPSPLAYPRDNPQFDDAAMLIAAVHYGTPQRAFELESILRLPLDALNPLHIAFAVVSAFEAEMEATEDLLGWMEALRRWQPGTAEFSLFALLNQIQIGGRPGSAYAEDRLLTFYDALTAEEFRELLHLPSEDELRLAGVPDDLREQVSRSVPAHLDGVRQTLRFRQDEQRTRVAAFNKAKHLGLWRLAAAEAGGLAVQYVPSELRDGEFRIKTLSMAANKETVALMAGRGLAAQAVLNSILGLLLKFRYQEDFLTPDWALRAFSDLGVWRDKPLGN